MVIGDGGSALPRFAIGFFKPNALISPSESRASSALTSEIGVDAHHRMI